MIDKINDSILMKWFYIRCHSVLLVIGCGIFILQLVLRDAAEEQLSYGVVDLVSERLEGVITTILRLTIIFYNTGKNMGFLLG